MLRNLSTEQLQNLMDSGSVTQEAAMSLVRLSANPNTKTTAKGNTLLHLFATNNANGCFDSTIKELIKTHKAVIDIENNDHLTPLQALLKNSFNTEAVMKLVRLGANPNTKNSEGESLLHLLIKNNKNGCNNIAIEELIDVHHANINIQNAAGFTPFQCFMNSGSVTRETAMTLVRLGADSNTKTDTKGNSLLHLLVTHNKNGLYDRAIKNLVTLYKADINIENNAGLTPLQNLLLQNFLENSFNPEALMKLVRLGAYPDTKNCEGESLLQLLVKNNVNGCNDAFIKELDELTTKHDIEKYHPLRNSYLHLLILLANDRKNESSTSFFKSFPIEIVSYIFSFLGSKKMGKTQQECFFLANTILSQPDKIKKMASTPGGINVFQRNNGDLPPTLTLFKSVKTLRLDFEKLKSHLKTTQTRKYPTLDQLRKKEFTTTSEKKLDEFRNTYAVSCLNEHASLYKKPENKQALLNSMKDTDLYTQSQLKSH